MSGDTIELVDLIRTTRCCGATRGLTRGHTECPASYATVDTSAVSTACHMGLGSGLEEEEWTHRVFRVLIPTDYVAVITAVAINFD